MGKTKKVLASLLAVALAVPGMATKVSAKDLTQAEYVTLDNGLEVKLIAEFNSTGSADAYMANGGDYDAQEANQAVVFDNNESTKVVFRKQLSGWGGVLDVGDYVGVEFKEPVSFKGIKYVFGDHQNDYFGNAKLQVKTETSDWTDLKSYEGTNVTSVDYTADADIVNVTAVRLVNGTYKDNNWVHLYEIYVNAEIPAEPVADYLAVTQAINAANALDKDNYLSFEAVEEAIAAVDYTLGADQQETIDGYAAAINAAIAALVQVKFEQDNDNITIKEVGNQQGQEPLSNVFDGNPTTLWHTDWNGSDRSTHHFTLEVEEELYSGLKFLARPQNGADGDQNGVITKVNVYAKLGEEAEWTQVVTEATTNANGWQVVTFDAPIKADFIKFEVVEADSANTKLFASMAELKLNYVSAADYTKVTAALAKVPADLAGYTAETVEAVEEAIAAVIYDLDYSKQADVDAMAAAIETAVAALDVVLADYTKLNTQITIAEALDAQAYKDFTAVQAALDAAKAVEKDLPATSQADIDALEAALKAAIAALEEKEVELVTTEIPTSEMNVSAGSEQKNNATEGLASYAIDGRTDTLWHTDWSGAPRADHWFQVDFDNPKEVNGMKVLQRGGDWPNGRILTYNLLGRHSETGEWFVIIENGTLAENFNWQEVSFEPTEVQALRLVSLTSTTDTGIQFSALAEIRFTETGKVVTPFADYAAVNAAIEAANKLNGNLYVNFDAVEEAVAAVVKGLKVTEQATVDGYAAAINAAIEALVLKDADYSAVDSAIEAAGALDKDHYVDFSAVEEAIAAVVTGYKADKQAEVNAMAKAINDAILALVKNPADYTAVLAAINTIPEDLTIYTDESLEALEAALDAVVEGLDFTRQDEVDAFATAIEEAVEALTVKDADYTVVAEAIALIPEVLDIYTEESLEALDAALQAVIGGLDITKQADVDAMAAAIEEAVEALELLPADYTEVEALIEAVSKLNKDDYKDFTAVEEAVAAVVEGLDITDQDEVEAMANAIIEAILGLELKDAETDEPADPETPVEPEDPETPAEPEEPADPETPVQPEKPAVPGETDDNVNTSDLTSVFGLVSMMLASVFGILTSRKRKED